MKYKRIILKLSGEAIKGNDDIINYDVFDQLVEQIKILQENDIEIAIVIGGGNIFRGFGINKIEEEKGHYMGMLSTTINAIALNSYLNKNGIKSIMQNSLAIENISDGINNDDAKKCLDAGFVMIFGGGTGKPFVSTDTGAAIRATDLDADVILMAKNGVDGVYSSDPRIDKNAEFLPKLTFKEIKERKLEVMDIEAIKYLIENDINVIVFNMDKIENISKSLIEGEIKKTIITN